MKMKETKNTKSDFFLQMPITGLAVVLRSWLSASSKSYSITASTAPLTATVATATATAYLYMLGRQL